MEELNHPLNQSARAALRKPDAAFAFQRVNERVYRGGFEGVAANQKRLERQKLTDFLVLHEFGDHIVNRLVRAKFDELRGRRNHLRKFQERCRAKLFVTLAVKLFRISKKFMIPCHVIRVAGSNLLFEKIRVVIVIEHFPIFPLQAVKRIHRQQGDIVVHILAGKIEELFQAIRVGDDGWAAVKFITVFFIDIGPPARLVAIINKCDLKPHGLQSDSERNSAKPSANNDRGRHFTVLRFGNGVKISRIGLYIHALSRFARSRLIKAFSEKLYSAFVTGTGGLPIRMRALSAVVSCPA